MGKRGPVEFAKSAKGSYNLVLKSQIHDGAIPNCNEVHWMQYFEELRIATVRHIYSWSSERSLGDIDPYILMDFVEGETLHACWARWDSSTVEADKAKLRTALRHLAEILLELSRIAWAFAW
ncbi:hypothetical protein Sste5346_003393 [Sporothrix stenoceras]|uniref:Protein kinase domain-containing protein n=1 Tax=Sporothrix stenoceras TaxID=5173 RepID=A0ABR3ZDM2_9PEZI